jgi:hypothetical protein
MFITFHKETLNMMHNAAEIMTCRPFTITIYQTLGERKGVFIVNTCHFGKLLITKLQKRGVQTFTR